MKKTAVRSFRLLIKRPESIRGLATALGLSYPTVASGVKWLADEGLCERTNGSIRIKPSPETRLLGSILSKYDGVKLLAGSREKVLMSIIEPSTILQVVKRTGLAEQTVYRILRELKGMLAVSVSDGKYFVGDEELKGFLKSRRAKILEKEEVGVTVLYSNDITLKLASKGLEVLGALTAFSRFADFGVDFGAETRDFFVEPPMELGAEEVLVHALLASRNPVETTMCAVFYVKNKEKIDVGKVKRMAKGFGILDMWLDLVALCRGAPLRDAKRFLPWDEFREKAAVYNVTVEPPFEMAKVHKLLTEIGRRLKEELHVYCFGGANLMLAGLKEATRDVDLVVEKKGEFEALREVLLSVGYEPLSPHVVGGEIGRLEPSGIFVSRDLPRVDLFTKQICRALQLTETMKKNSTSMRFGNLTLNLLSLEAVFVLKSITEREGDLLDMEIIARHGVDWGLVERIYWEEEQLTGRHWCLDVLGSLEIIQQRTGARIPFLQRLSRHCLEYGICQSLKLGARTIEDLRKYLDFPESTIRRAVERLASRGEIKTVKRGKLVYLSSVP